MAWAITARAETTVKRMAGNGQKRFLQGLQHI